VFCLFVRTLIKRGHAPIIAIHYLPIRGYFSISSPVQKVARQGDGLAAASCPSSWRSGHLGQLQSVCSASYPSSTPLIFPLSGCSALAISPPDLRLTLPVCVENIRKRRRRSLRFPQQVSAKPWARFSLLKREDMRMFIRTFYIFPSLSGVCFLSESPTLCSFHILYSNSKTLLSDRLLRSHAPHARLVAPDPTRLPRVLDMSAEKKAALHFFESSSPLAEASAAASAAAFGH